MTTPQDGERIELANEFAVVHVRQVHTHNGVRLEIASPRLGRRIRLDPVELESLTWQRHEVFSGFLETPFGPEAEVEADEDADLDADGDPAGTAG